MSYSNSATHRLTMAAINTPAGERIDVPPAHSEQLALPFTDTHRHDADQLTVDDVLAAADAR